MAIMAIFPQSRPSPKGAMKCCPTRTAATNRTPTRSCWRVCSGFRIACPTLKRLKNQERIPKRYPLFFTWYALTNIAKMERAHAHSICIQGQNILKKKPITNNADAPIVIGIKASKPIVTMATRSPIMEINIKIRPMVLP